MDYTNLESCNECSISNDIEHSSEEENIKCTICLEYITEDRIDLKCNHSFHKKCINKWENQTCPLCRANISYLSYCKKINKNYRNCIIFISTLLIGFILIPIGMFFKMPCIYYNSQFICELNHICKWNTNDNTLCNYKCWSKYQCYLDCSNCCYKKDCLEFGCKWNNITQQNNTVQICSYN